MNMKNKVLAYNDELIALRRYFHENPEPSGYEPATIAYINAYAQKLGWEVQLVEDGGLLAIIDSGKPGKTLLMRADVDALPIAENPSNLKHPKQCCSKVAGVSHACGHDCHTAMTMTAGKILSAHKEQWSGRLVLCFERGEETGGNIKNLLPYIVEKSGLSIDGCYATHVRWDMPVGTVSIQPGPVMAGGLGFTFKLKGLFGHGARPDLANNPLDCFVAIYQDLQACPMRLVNPYECLTFSIGKIQAGEQINVIPGELVFGGTSRFFNLKAAGQPFMATLLSSLKHNCELYNCTYEILHMPDPLYEVRNNAACAQLCQTAVTEVLGSEVLYSPEPWMASESYALYLQKFPGILTFTGIANEELGSGANHHTPEFDVDESGLINGVTMAVSYALAFFSTPLTTDFIPSEENIYKLALRNT